MGAQRSRRGGRAVIRHRDQTEVRLVELPPSRRLQIPRSYLEVAPSADQRDGRVTIENQKSCSVATAWLHWSMPIGLMR